MATQLEQVWKPSEGDTDDGAIDGEPYLDSDETFTGTPTLSAQQKWNATTSSWDTDTDITVSNLSVSTAPLTILNRSVATGKAVQFTYSGQQEGAIYRLRISVGTSESRTKVFDQRIEVQD